MARRISLEKNWQLSGYKAYGDGGNISETEQIPFDFPSSIEGALEKSGIIGGYLADARGCEWVNDRVWVAEKVFVLPEEPEDAESERNFLQIEDIHGYGYILINDEEAARFGSGESLLLDVTGFLHAAEENTIAIVFLKNDIAARENTLKIYGGLPAPVTAPRGIGGEIFLRDVSYGIIKSISAGVKDGKVAVEAVIDAFNRGKYTLKYRLTRGKLLAGSSNVTENLIASRQTIAQEIGLDGFDGELEIRITLERGGVRCDFDQRCVTGEQRALETAEICAVSWSPLSPYLSDVRPDDYKKALLLLKKMGATALFMRRRVKENSVFYDECAKMGLMILREGENDDWLRSAAEVYLSGKKDPRELIKSARSTGRPILIHDAVTLFGDGSDGLFTANIKTGRMYACIKQAMEPWIIILDKKSAGDEVGGSQYEIISCCKNPNGEAVVAELTFMDISGAPIYSQNFNFTQDRKVVITEAFWVYILGGAAAAAVSIKAYTQAGLAADYRHVYGERFKGNEPSVERFEGVIRLVNNTPEYIADAVVLGEDGGAGIVTMLPWERRELP